VFIDILDNLCQKLGTTPYKTCEQIGLNRSAVAKWKKGSAPNGKTLNALSEHFGVSVNYLLGQESLGYAPTSELLRLRKLLGSGYQLRVITNITCVCKELPNGYILVVNCHKLSEDNFCDATIEVWNYAFQPFIKKTDDCSGKVEVLKFRLSELEKEYLNKPKLGIQKEKASSLNEKKPEDITFDDFSYALLDESKELTEENKDKLLEMAKFFKQQQDKEKSKD
jgi:transcriptional regulator with XRE-family HTH domain